MITRTSYLVVATEPAEQALLLVAALRGLSKTGLAIASSGSRSNVRGGSSSLAFLLVAAVHHVLDLVHSYRLLTINWCRRRREKLRMRNED